MSTQNEDGRGTPEDQPLKVGDRAVYSQHGTVVATKEREVQMQRDERPDYATDFAQARARVAKLESAIRSFCGPFGMPKSVGTVGYIVALEKVLEVETEQKRGADQ